MKMICPHCGVRGSADESYAGSVIRCPKCRGTFVCVSDADVLIDDFCLEQVQEQIQEISEESVSEEVAESSPESDGNTEIPMESDADGLDFLDDEFLVVLEGPADSQEAVAEPAYEDEVSERVEADEEADEEADSPVETLVGDAEAPREELFSDDHDEAPGDAEEEYPGDDTLPEDSYDTKEEEFGDDTPADSSDLSCDGEMVGVSSPDAELIGEADPDQDSSASDELDKLLGLVKEEEAAPEAAEEELHLRSEYTPDGFGWDVADEAEQIVPSPVHSEQIQDEPIQDEQIGEADSEAGLSSADDDDEFGEYRNRVDELWAREEGIAPDSSSEEDGENCAACGIFVPDGEGYRLGRSTYCRDCAPRKRSVEEEEAAVTEKETDSATDTAAEDEAPKEKRSLLGRLFGSSRKKKKKVEAREQEILPEAEPEEISEEITTVQEEEETETVG